MKKVGVNKAAGKAVDELAGDLTLRAENIARSALENARHARRKVVNRSDVELAIKHQ